MKHEHTIVVRLRCRGAVLSKASGAARWGVDQGMNRDANRQPVINGSHIKGKLREALADLAASSGELADLVGVSTLDPHHWLGEAAHNDIRPVPGLLHFGDFHLFRNNKLADNPTRGRTRLRLDPKRGSAIPGALLVQEELEGVRAGDESVWVGEVRVKADKRDLPGIRQLLMVGLRWQTSVGGGTSTGLGRLIAVEISDANGESLTSSKPIGSLRGEGVCALTLEAPGPLFIGGNQRRGNYLESLDHVPGSVIKGALARGLWESFASLREGASLGYRIDETHPAEAEFPLTCRHFENLRFLEARPGQATRPRPQAVPLSLAWDGQNQRWLDEAWSKGDSAVPLSFRPDWKPEQEREALDQAGWVGQDRVELVRTAINEQVPDSGRFRSNPRRKAADSLLHSQIRVALPQGAVYRGGVSLPDVPAETRTRLATELTRLIPLVLTGVGKGHAQVRCVLGEAPDQAPIRAGRWRLTLETPALLLDPAKVQEMKQQDLQPLYEEWLAECGPGLTLLDRWCRQELRGGYLGRRFGTGNSEYRPFLLESAGSCWLLDVTSEGAKCLEDWRRNGLPLPAWAREQYALGQPEAWTRCPFLPTNGFGELRLDEIKLEEN